MLDRIVEAVRKAGEVMLSAKSGYKIERKANEKDYVTEFDVKSLEVLVEERKKILPEANFLCEETPESHNADISEGCWFIIDPIDGTTNFMKDFSHSAVSAALYENGEPKIGVVYNPFVDEMYYAEKGKGAYLNGKEIFADTCGIEGGMGLMGASPTAPEISDKTFAMAKLIYDKLWDIRRTGSAALDLCYVAAGRAVVYCEYVIYPWDLAAGTLILSEAGGIATRTNGERLEMKGRLSVLAGTKKAHGEFLELLKENNLAL